MFFIEDIDKGQKWRDKDRRMFNRVMTVVDVIGGVVYLESKNCKTRVSAKNLVKRWEQVT